MDLQQGVTKVTYRVIMRDPEYFDNVHFEITLNRLDIAPHQGHEDLEATIKAEFEKELDAGIRAIGVKLINAFSDTNWTIDPVKQYEKSDIDETWPG